MGQRLAGLGYHVTEERPLGGGQVHENPLARDLPAEEVDRDRAVLDHRLVADALELGGATQVRTYPGQQLVAAEGLGHVVVGTGIEQAHLLVLRVTGRDDDHGSGAREAQLPAHLLARHVREPQVEDHQIRMLGVREHQGARPGLGFEERIADRAERDDDRLTDRALVVHDQDAALSGRRLGLLACVHSGVTVGDREG